MAFVAFVAFVAVLALPLKFPENVVAVIVATLEILPLFTLMLFTLMEGLPIKPVALPLKFPEKDDAVIVPTTCNSVDGVFVPIPISFVGSRRTNERGQRYHASPIK